MKFKKRNALTPAKYHIVHKYLQRLSRFNKSTAPTQQGGLNTFSRDSLTLCPAGDRSRAQSQTLLLCKAPPQMPPQVPRPEHTLLSSMQSIKKEATFTKVKELTKTK